MSENNWKSAKETPPKSQFGYSVELLIKLQSGEKVKGYYSFRNNHYCGENHKIIHDAVEWSALGETELTTINYSL